MKGRKLNDLICAVMALSALLIVLAGLWYLSRRVEAAPRELSSAVSAALLLPAPGPDPLPEPEPDPAPEPEETVPPYIYDPAIPLSRELQTALHNACYEFGVPEALALGVIEVESGFDPAADNGVSHGLMQINAKYAWWLEEQSGYSSSEPEGNLYCGVWYLSHLIKAHDGSIDKALVAYNQGSYKGVVTQYAKNVRAAAERWAAP